MKKLGEILYRVLFGMVVLALFFVAIDEMTVYAEKLESKLASRETHKVEAMGECLDKTEDSIWCRKNILE